MEQVCRVQIVCAPIGQRTSLHRWSVRGDGGFYTSPSIKNLFVRFPCARWAMRAAISAVQPATNKIRPCSSRHMRAATVSTRCTTAIEFHRLGLDLLHPHLAALALDLDGLQAISARCHRWRSCTTHSVLDKPKKCAHSSNSFGGGDLAQLFTRAA